MISLHGNVYGMWTARLHAQGHAEALVSLLFLLCVLLPTAVQSFTLNNKVFSSILLLLTTHF